MREGGAGGIEQAARRMFQQMMENGGWDEQQQYIISAIEETYQRNGWSSEPDQFSLGLIREVSAIPPWQVSDRLDAFTGRLSDRYLLDDQQEGKLRGLLVREWSGLFQRHAGEVLPVISEAIQTRMAGEPFTPEQVARWTEATAALSSEARERFDVASGEFLEQLDPQQQQLVQMDLAAENRRLDRVDEMRTNWQQGQWTPGDWGLTRDPIQRGERMGGMKPGAGDAGMDATGGQMPGGGGVAGGQMPGEGGGPGAGGKAGGEPGSGEAYGAGGPDATRKVVGGRAGDEPSGPWADYVRGFIRRFELNAGQQQRAWSIYRSACDRRDLYDKRASGRIELAERNLASGGRGSGDERLRAQLSDLQREQSAYHDTIFDALKTRLERLLTRAQQRAASQPGATSAPATPVLPEPVKTELGGP